MNGLGTQNKLHEALRYLREQGKYALQQPVEKKPAAPSILMLHKMLMVASRGR